jgi:hypothetical protein
MENSKWSVDLAQFVAPNHFVRIKYKGKVLLYLNYALGLDRVSVAKNLVEALNKKEVTVALPDYDDDADLQREGEENDFIRFKKN